MKKCPATLILCVLNMTQKSEDIYYKKDYNVFVFLWKS